ncbi:hypothetical protein [Parahaliea mediterranea]|uniref:Uncharacterized protein n=1 Tax=Parahaliea mediterranea TaxID=651086 RepID=A0A939DD85_9GAMM|nr:hypothetical protein [Parahaliea mediterranea]MBN7796100.1 hypothetical protein [Parahaliea mediterranea]
MSRHMLVMFPLLVVGGVALAYGLPRSFHARLLPWNREGIPGLALAAAMLMTWMIPNALDSATESLLVDALKAVCLVVAGFALAVSMPVAGLVAQLFFVWNSVMMLVYAGVLYQSLPTRLCSAYLIDDQAQTGLYLVCFAVLLGMAWLGHAWCRLRFASSSGPGRRSR